MTRRQALPVLGALVAAPLVPGPARAEDADLRIAVNAVDTSGQAYYAQEMGFFAKVGLRNVSLQTLASGAAQASALASGAIDVSIANVVTLAQAHAKGIPFVLIAGGGVYSTETPTTVLMVAESSPIRKAADLNGKTIGVSILKSLADYSVDSWIDRNGGDSKTVKYVEMPLADMVAGLPTGRVDAALVIEPFVAEARKTCRILGKAYDGVAPHFLIAGYFATATWAKAHPEIVRKFQVAMREAAAWGNANHARSAEIIAKVAKMRPEDVRQMTRAVYEAKLEPNLIQPAIDVTARYGGIPSFRASEIIFTA
jgi:NitT/TauT family transport system substrate-binding protein